MSEPLVLKNGKIWTGSSFAGSAVIRGGRIESLDAPAPDYARVIDLRGRLAVPGFIDSHLHFVMGSLQLENVQLRDANSLEVFTQRIAAHGRKLGRFRWITGGAWDEQQWTPATTPTRRDIDAVTPDNPVFVTRLDLHSGLANSLALQLAGISRETPDPPGGAIERDASGEPTGIIKDAAINLISPVIPPPSIAERITAIRAGLREAARLGVTSFCDMGMKPDAFDDLRAYERLDRAGELTARVFMYLPITEWTRLRDAGLESGFGSERLRVAGLKGFADGSLGSLTAAFKEPYEGEECNCGLLMQPMSDGSMGEWIARSNEHNLQLAIHAIGDRANDEVLRIFESLPDYRERRLRVEHAQHLDPDLVRRFAEGKVVASMQPYHAVDDGRWANGKIGEKRARYAFAFRSLLESGANVCFGSDWPVAPLNPIEGIHAAVTRSTIDGLQPGGWIPEEKITVEEALRCYTSRAAWTVFAENEIGSIAPGMRADIAVLSDDIFTIAPGEIGGVSVELTISGGRIVYES